LSARTAEPPTNFNRWRYDQTMSLTLSHNFLIAMPALADTNFAGTVTYLCQHDADGALGIVINRPAPLNLRQLLQRLDLPYTRDDDVPVFTGGPMNPQNGFILHEAIPGYELSVDLGNDLMFSTARDLLAAIGRGDGPARFLVALGYAGWGPGQIEVEIGENSWLTCTAAAAVLFDTPPEDRVRRAAAILGIDFSLLNAQPGYA
jgi:putative transcriptional regulator